MICPNCHAEVIASAKFCHKCGKKLFEPDSPESPSAMDSLSDNKQSAVKPFFAAAAVLLILALISGFLCFGKSSQLFSAEKRQEALDSRKAEVDAFEAAKWDRYLEIMQLMRTINDFVSSVDVNEIQNAEAVLKELLSKEAALKKDLEHIGELTEKDYSYIYDNSSADTRETDIKEWIAAKQDYLKEHPLPTDEEIDRASRNANGALSAGSSVMNRLDRDIDNELFDSSYKIDVDNEYADFPETHFDKDLKKLTKSAETDAESHRAPFIISLVLTSLLTAGFVACLIAALVKRARVQRQMKKSSDTP